MAKIYDYESWETKWNSARYKEQFDPINTKGITGKHKNDIVEGIKTKYKELYPDVDVHVKYVKEGKVCYFQVFIEAMSFGYTAPYEPQKTWAMVEKYCNRSAIELFSTMDKAAFDKFDDSKQDNIGWLKEQIDAMKTAYALQDITLFDIHVYDKGWSINYYKGQRIPGRYGVIRGCFDKAPISLASAKNAAKKIRTTIDRYIKNPSSDYYD